MNKTRNYLIEFQAENKLVADGIVGFNTMRALTAILGLKSRRHLAFLLGQVKVESANYSAFRENLFYSRPETLCNTFPRYFKTREQAVPYIKNPEKLANYVYANRMGNGDVKSGDGFRYRGLGGIQLTGKYNIEGYLKYKGLSLDTNLNNLDNATHFFQTSLYYFQLNNIFNLIDSNNQLSDTVITQLVSRQVNLGTYKSHTEALHEELRINSTLKLLSLT